MVLTDERLVVGTRGSMLARAQTQWVMDRLVAAHPGLQVEMRIISTAGDRDQKTPLPEVGLKGLFTLELEQALLDGTVDLAVHSAKDLPSLLSHGLEILACPVREDPRDAWIAADGTPFDSLPSGSVVGTSSLRRQAQLLMVWLRRLAGEDKCGTGLQPPWIADPAGIAPMKATGETPVPHLKFIPLRGNIDTRIRKVQEGQCAGAVLAMAGLNRAGLADRVTHPFEAATCLPAAGQGALALEGRSNDDRVRNWVQAIRDEATTAAISCERAILAELQAGCRAPVAIHATVQDGSVHCEALVIDPSGTVHIRAAGAEPLSSMTGLTRRIVSELKDGGAERIIAQARGDAAGPGG